MNRRLRVAFISPFVFRLARGIERFTINLANQLAQLDQDITIIAHDPDGRKATPAISRDVRVRRVPTFRYFEEQAVVPFYASELLRSRFDIVNVFFAGYGEAEALRLVRRMRPLAINFIVGYPFRQAPSQFHDFARRGLAPLLDRVIVKSLFMSPEIEQFFARQVEIIPNGIDLSYFNRDALDGSTLPTELGLEPDESVLLTVAALEDRKGILSVINVLPGLLARGLRVRYVIVGEGRDRTKIEQRVRELKLDDRVHLMGVHAEVRPFYKLADVFLLPSYGEGFPNAFLEALAMELPVIVSKHPPYDEIAKPAFGLQVDEKDTGALSEAIVGLIQNPARRRAMGRAGCEHVHATYSWPRIAQSYLELFRTEAPQ